MKGIYLVCLSIVSLLITSCKEDVKWEEEKTQTQQEFIIGQWQLVSIREAVGVQKDITTDCDRKSTITFSADKKISRVDYQNLKGFCDFQINEQNFSISKDEIIFKNEKSEDKYTYSIKNNVLTLQSPKKGTFIYNKNLKYNKNTPQKGILGLWRLVSITEQDNYQVEISNCSRKSSLTFDENNKVIRVNYSKGEKDCPFTTENKTYTISEKQIIFNSEGKPEVYQYTLTDDILVLTSSTQETITYKKNLDYNPAKELVGTWYIHHLKYDYYDDFQTLSTYNGCRGKEKVIFTEKDITIYQYAITGIECKEIIYKGTYEISPNLTTINVISQKDGTKASREFGLSEGTLIFFGLENGGRLEEKFYRKEQKYKQEKY